MMDDAERRAALSRYFRAIQVQTAEGWLAAALALALATLLGAISPWISLLLVAAVTLWTLAWGLILGRIRTRRPTGPFKVEALNRLTDRFIILRLISRPIILLEAVALVAVTILRLTGHLRALMGVH